MQNSYDLSDLEAFGIVGVVAVSALTFFGIVRNRQIQSITSTSSVRISNDEYDSISKALSEYTGFIKKAGVDKETIWQILCEHDSELSAYDEQITIEHTKLEKSKTIIAGVTHFQKTGLRTKPRHSRYSELLMGYRELVKTYPIAEFHSWTTDEERDGLSLEMVEEAHANYEVHHTKLLGIAEDLLTESGVTVQRARNIIEKLSAPKSLSKQLKL